MVDVVDVRDGERCICRRPAAPSPKVHPSHQGTVLSSSATARPALKQMKRVGLQGFICAVSILQGPFTCLSVPHFLPHTSTLRTSAYYTHRLSMLMHVFTL